MMFRFRNMLLATTALILLGIVTAAANPLGSQVVGGAANVQGQGTSTVTVTQSTDKAIINWQTFNIGTGETTQFVLPNASSVTLNRVTGNLGASVLDGTLTANGRIFLVNPDGILFGAGSKINTGSFLATTNDIRNVDFMAGRYQFTIPGRSDASIVNLGMITAQNGGFAALVAPGVRNTGTITANLGTIGLAAGNNFSLDFYGDRLITLGLNDSIAAKVIDVATGRPLNALVRNDGKLKANGGRIELTAAAARQVVDSVINNTGVIEANSIGSKNGMIVLGAATTATKAAGVPAQTVKLSGTISAVGKRKNTKGGTIIVSGENILLTSATIDASGQAGGGKILVGGDVGGGKGNAAVVANPKAALEVFSVANASMVSVDAATTIIVSAKLDGDGGKVVVWSDQATTFYGTIKAQGGAQFGNGGFVETSGHQSLTFNGGVDTSAPQGRNGMLLLDPQDALITTNAGPGVVTVASIQAALSNGDVVVTTGSAGSDRGNITVAASVGWSNANTLTLSAYKDINVNTTIVNSGGAAVNLRADNTGTGVGTVNFGNGATISTSGGISIFYNPAVNPANSAVNILSYASPTENFIGNATGGGTLTAYMLVNSVFDLQNIQNNLSGTYALGKNIDATIAANWNGGAGFTPIGYTGFAANNGPSTQGFTGLINGQGHTIKNLEINADANSFVVGLVGWNFGTIENVGLANVSISRGNFDVGALSGINYGTISSSWSSGAIVTSSSEAGGLVGLNVGRVQNSYSNASVNVSSGGGAGGLVGSNYAACTPGCNASIFQSYATGQVSGATAGGLVADNTGTIQQSFASGPVFGTGGGYVGGLAGDNFGTIVQSYASSSVNGTGFYVAGFVGYNSGFIGGLLGISSPGTISQSYSTGAVSSGAGFVYLSEGGQVTNSYWDIQATGQAVSGAGVGSTTAALMSGLPSGFSSSVWGSNAAINHGYPHLLWAAATPPPRTTTVLTPESGAPAPTPPQPLMPPGALVFPTQQTAFFAPIQPSPASGLIPIVVTDDDIRAEGRRLLERLFAQANKKYQLYDFAQILADVSALVGSFDSRYHDLQNNEALFVFRGRVLTGSDLNYYFQGLFFSTYGWPKETLITAIAAWKLSKYGRLPSENAIWAASQGYSDGAMFEFAGMR